jgi:hypothetical protein
VGAIGLSFVIAVGSLYGWWDNRQRQKRAGEQAEKRYGEQKALAAQQQAMQDKVLRQTHETRANELLMQCAQLIDILASLHSLQPITPDKMRAFFSTMGARRPRENPCTCCGIRIWRG